MARYAENTTVDVTRSRIELENIIRRFGGTNILTLTTEQQAVVQFSARERTIRLTLGMPDPNSKEFTHSSRGLRTDSAAKEQYEKEARRRWRSLVLLVKAKVTAINDGIVEFEEEFLPHILMADGSTLYQRTKENIALEYREGKPQPLLLSHLN